MIEKDSTIVSTTYRYLEKTLDKPIDIPRLWNEYSWFLNDYGTVTDDPSIIDFNAICLNRKPGDTKSITGGNVRGKYWTYPTDRPIEEERLPYVDEESYTEICPEFLGTYTEEIINALASRWKIGRARFLMKPPRSCLSWHRDPERRIHIPVKTNLGCRMVIEDEAFHMPADGTIYITDNRVYHNFFNGGEENRIHLVVTLLEP